MPKMSLPEIQKLVAKEFLPDPEKTVFAKYNGAYFDIYGPPPRVRAEKLSPHISRPTLLASLNNTPSKKFKPPSSVLPRLAFTSTPANPLCAA